MLILRRRWAGPAAVLALAAAAAGCGSSEDTSGAVSSAAGAASSAADTGATTQATTTSKGTGAQSKFFVQADFDRQLRQRSVTPTGPADKPWEQAIEPQMVNTTQYKKAPPWNICFSNAGVNNPWRVIGYKTMQAEVKLHPEIKSFTHVDAEGQDAKQIADMADLATKGCDALIVAPNTTGPLTPAVEAACKVLPVIDFDRGVETDCPVTFVHPIGGYVFGADAAEFLTKNVKKGGKILALRILPGVDVLETRWSAAKVIFDKAGANVVGVEFTNGDPAKTKQIVSDYIQKEGTIDGVWMDAGATSVAATEAFEDAGVDVPPITGEDQNDFLTKWKQDGLKAVAPTYPTYQWRTAVIAATKVLSGQQVPKEWVLPQPQITQDDLDKYVAADMPPLFYALCGCQKMPGFPQNWK